MIVCEGKETTVKLVSLVLILCKNKKMYHNSNGRDINKRYYNISGVDNFFKYRELNTSMIGAKNVIKKKDFKFCQSHIPLA